MIQEDDKARFGALFEAHRRAVLTYARRRVGPDAAPDVVADTFLVAWRRLDAVPDDPLPWLYGVARRVIANHRRTADRSAALRVRIAGERRPPAPSFEHAVDLADALKAGLARLGERDREALLLVAWEGLDTERAARAAGCSRAAFAVRLHRARRRLAAALEPDTPHTLPLGVTHEA